MPKVTQPFSPKLESRPLRQILGIENKVTFHAGLRGSPPPSPLKALLGLVVRICSKAEMACATQETSRTSSLVTGPLGTLSQPIWEAPASGLGCRGKKDDVCLGREGSVPWWQQVQCIYSWLSPTTTCHTASISTMTDPPLWPLDAFPSPGASSENRNSSLLLSDSSVMSAQ